MNIIKSNTFDQYDIKKNIIAIGSFDGIHKGHQKILNKTIKLAKKEGLRSGVLTFEPHPQEVVDNQDSHQYITSLAQKRKILNDMGFDVKDESSAIILDASSYEFKEIYKLKEKLKNTIISGIKGVEQILIVKRGRDFVIITLGTNLKEMVKLKEVDSSKIVSNDLHEVAGIFGIEAARQLIIDEIKEVINSQGLDIDERHLKLAADAMTNTGDVKGVTRMGIIAQKASILARATFETPTKQFVNAIIKGQTDKLESVIENIILNQPVPVGTGLPGLAVNVVGKLTKKEEEKKTADSKIVEGSNQ